jgi:hypothetical protein
MAKDSSIESDTACSACIHRIGCSVDPRPFDPANPQCRAVPHRKWRRVTERLVLSLVTLVCAAATLTATSNMIAQRYYQSIYKAPGKLCEVGGYRMHLYRTGQGAPTPVLEAGWTVPALGWGTVQPELAKTTKVCSYDRAGYGWSEPQPGPRDADQIATQLHALLQHRADYSDRALDGGAIHSGLCKSLS